jgi:hypothetical protein
MGRKWKSMGVRLRSMPLDDLPPGALIRRWDKAGETKIAGIDSNHARDLAFRRLFWAIADKLSTEDKPNFISTIHIVHRTPPLNAP